LGGNFKQNNPLVGGAAAAVILTRIIFSVHAQQKTNSGNATQK
jgi:hypothetical protein